MFRHDEDGSGSPFARWLKPGWRHVAVCVESGPDGDRHWVMINAREWAIEFAVVAPLWFNLANYYRSFGHTVVETAALYYRPACPALPLVSMTCVGMVKRILGIHGWFVWTPWRLYRFLNKEIRS